MKTICIIGGGFSGFATALQLLQKSADVKIVLVNNGHPLVTGIAYSTPHAEHLLNVPAGKMSAFPDHPAHFTDWIRSKADLENLATENLSTSFLPRNVYGLYLQELMEKYELHPQLETVSAKAINVKTNKNSYTVVLDNGNSIIADALVLAMGNYLPAAPKISNSSILEHPHYFKSPWNDAYLKDLRDEETVLLIGTGLTMVDNVLSLKKQHFKGKIVVVSPRGYIPASHAITPVYPDFSEELQEKTLQEIFRIVRKHIKSAAEKNIVWQSVIDAIRPYTQQIWLQLSKKDRQQFVSHLRHIWGVARHRLPSSIHTQIMELLDSGQLEISAGRIQNMEPEQEQFSVSLRSRKEQTTKKLSVSRIVNCTGPQINFSELKDELVQGLITDGIIYPQELKMGIAALPNGQVLDKNGMPVKNVFAIGSLLRGVLWETTAVPEIRLQAENVARQICESTN